MPSDHIHKFRRGRYKTGTYFYKCTECPFVIVVSQSTGRVNRCWKCNNAFLLTRNDTKWAKPVCQSCRNLPSKKFSTSKMEDFLDDLVK